MINNLFRTRLSRFAKNMNTSITVLDNPSFDNSVMGVSQDNKLIYSYESMVQEYMDDNHCEYEEAVEFIEYNTMRALDYMDRAPVVMRLAVEDLSQ
jgi:hypothetical protein